MTERPHAEVLADVIERGLAYLDAGAPAVSTALQDLAADVVSGGGPPSDFRVLS